MCTSSFPRWRTWNDEEEFFARWPMARSRPDQARPDMANNWRTKRTGHNATQCNNINIHTKHSKTTQGQPVRVRQGKAGQGRAGQGRAGQMEAHTFLLKSLLSVDKGILVDTWNTTSTVELAKYGAVAPVERFRSRPPRNPVCLERSTWDANKYRIY